MNASFHPLGARNGLVVTLDGPASSGKTSVGGRVAEALGYRFVDTGLLYRGVTWLAQVLRVSLDDGSSVAELASRVSLGAGEDGRYESVLVDGMDVTEDVLSPNVDRWVSEVARQPEVRAALLGRQRELATGGAIVVAGRDIGTVVLPDADVKVFLEASPEERARRRAEQRGYPRDSPEADAILGDLRRRDEIDRTRPTAPLRPAADALRIVTDGLSLEETVAAVLAAVRAGEERRLSAQLAEETRAAEWAEAEQAALDEATAEVTAGAHDHEPEVSVESDADPGLEPELGAEPAPEPEPEAGGGPEPSAEPVAGQEVVPGVGPGLEPEAATEGEHAPADQPDSAPAAPGPDPATGSGPPRRSASARRESPLADHVTPFISLTDWVGRTITTCVTRVHIEGLDAPLDIDGPLIIACNHASNLDGVLVACWLTPALGRRIYLIGKQEALDVPLMGWALKQNAVIGVRRNAADLEAYRAARRVLDEGHVLGLFPEGTRSRDGRLQPAKEGAAILALRTGAPILPVGVSGTHRVWPRDSKLFRPGGHVRMRVGTPFRLPPASGADRRRLQGEATRTIMTRIAELLPRSQRGVYADDVDRAHGS